jgi:hypothetical protein
VSFRTRPAMILWSLLLAACGERAATAETSDADVTDSAGVRVVSSSGTDKPLPWTFTERHVYSDSTGEPMLFNGLHESLVVVGRAGDVFVLEHGNNSVAHFDSTGRMLGRLGKKGRGPGELGLPLSMAIRGDTITVLDVSKDALVRWTTAGKIVPEQRLEGEDRHLQGAFAWVNDALLFDRRTISDSADLSTLIRATPAGDSALLSVSGKRGAPVAFKCMQLSAAQPIFSPALYWSAAQNGVAVNAEQRYVVWIYDGKGRRTMSIRRDVPVRAPTLDDVRLLYPEGMKMVGGAGACTVPVEEVVQKQGLSPTMPVIHALQLLDDGTLWVRRTLRAVKPVVTDVFSKDGAYLGTVQGVRVLRMLPGGDLLVSKDDDDTGGQLLARVSVSRIAAK